MQSGSCTPHPACAACCTALFPPILPICTLCLPRSPAARPVRPTRPDWRARHMRAKCQLSPPRPPRRCTWVRSFVCLFVNVRTAAVLGPCTPRGIGHHSATTLLCHHSSTLAVHLQSNTSAVHAKVMRCSYHAACCLTGNRSAWPAVCLCDTQSWLLRWRTPVRPFTRRGNHASRSSHASRMPGWHGAQHRSSLQRHCAPEPEGSLRGLHASTARTAAVHV